MNLHRLFSAAAISVGVAAALAACGSSAPSSHAPNEAFGTVRADLVAVGPNGVTYQMPANAVFVLTPTAVADGGTQASDLFFDTTSNTAQTFSVPVGTYTGVLQGGPPWALVNTSTNSTANAVLLDTQPFNVSITAGITTPLAFHFALAGVGNVTFGTGTLSTSFAVASSDGGTPTGGNFGASLGISGVQQTGGTGSPNQGITNLVTQGSPIAFSLMPQNFTITTPFAPGVDVACASISVPQAKPLPMGMVPNGSTAVLDLFSEATQAGATGILCLYDKNGNVPNGVVIQFERTGAPTQSSVVTALNAPANQTFTFVSTIYGQATTALYDGVTVQLSQLASTQSIPVAETGIFFDPGAADEVDALGGPGTPGLPATGGSLQLQLTP